MGESNHSAARRPAVAFAVAFLVAVVPIAIMVLVLTSSAARVDSLPRWTRIAGPA